MSTSVSANGSTPQSNLSGAASVRDFFSSIPWTGQPLPMALSQTAPEEVSPAVGTLTMNLSVKTFFSSFAWEGKPTVAAPLPPLAIQPDMPSQEDDLTLDGFADLF